MKDSIDPSSCTRGAITSRRITRIRFGRRARSASTSTARSPRRSSGSTSARTRPRLVAVAVEPIRGTEPTNAAPDFDHRGPRAPSLVRGWERESTQVVTDNGVFNQLLDRSLRDLRALYTRVRDGAILAAGIPWYVTIFGRDSLIASHQLLMVNTRPARDALELLAARQGTEENDWRDEQPGKIPHEVRDGELARAGSCRTRPTTGRWTRRRGS